MDPMQRWTLEASYRALENGENIVYPKEIRITFHENSTNCKMLQLEFPLNNSEDLGLPSSPRL